MADKKKSFTLLGIEFAPFWIPIERRLQTFAVLCWLSTFTLLNTLGVAGFLWALFFSNTYRWLAILYIGWVVYDWKSPERGGRKLKYTPFGPFNRYFKDYFPIELIKTADLHPDGKYLLCSHPHGAMPAGINVATGTNVCGWDEKFPGLDVRCCTVPINFTFFGIHREFVLACGMVSSTKASIEYMFSKTKGIVTILLPGGAHEARNWSKDQVKLYLNKRKGFIKLALRFGVDLVPTFSFNEQYIFKQITVEKGSKLMKFQNFVEATLGFIPVLFFGRGIFNYTFGLLPYRKPINVVVGSPVKVKRSENPTREEIEKMHAIYVKELQKLYDKYNPIYGDKNVKLVIE